MKLGFDLGCSGARMALPTDRILRAGALGFGGGKGAQQRDFHTDAMAARGFAAEAEPVRDSLLAGRQEKAAVPDACIDEGALTGPETRIAERFARWQQSGITLLRLNNSDAASMEAIATIARKQTTAQA